MTARADEKPGTAVSFGPDALWATHRIDSAVSPKTCAEPRWPSKSWRGFLVLRPLSVEGVFACSSQSWRLWPNSVERLSDRRSCETVDARLIPINGVIALLRGEGGWPAILGEEGFKRHQLEMPLNTPKGDVRADALLYRQSPDLILPCECKSGRNVDVEQAEKYLSLDVGWLKRSGAIPPPLKESESVAVQTLYVGTDQHRPELEQGLRPLGTVPLLTIDAERVQLSGAGRTPGLQDFIHLHTAGLPPARLPVDHQSDEEEVLELLIPAIMAAQASLKEYIGMDRLCEDILPEWPVLGERARREFVGRVAQLATGLANGEMKGQFRYESPTGLQPHTMGRLVITDSPASRHPQGRTQAFQARQRKAEKVLRRKSRKEPPPGQGSLLDDLAQEGGLADE